MKKGIDHVGVTIVYFCHDENGRVIMAKRKNTCRDEVGCWDIGGGGLEFGDTVEETLKKEIKEEYLTDVLDFEFLGYRDVHRSHGEERSHWIALDFKVLIDVNKVGNGEPHKFEHVDWFTLDNLPTPVHSQFPTFLNKYFDQLISKK